MVYLHDVWVNWFEGEEHGYGVCAFHEWRKSDHVELIDQVPVLKVESDLLNRIENSLEELPSRMLTDIYQEAFIRRNHERFPIDYCAILTDGIIILAIDTIGYSIPMRKSRLVPRQEQQVLEVIKRVNVCHYEMDTAATVESNLIMAGLTRKERQLKQILLLALDQLRVSRNVAEIRYWFTEWFPGKYHEVLQADFEEIWKKLYAHSTTTWSDSHAQLCEKMIKGQAYLEQLWENEMGERSK